MTTKRALWLVAEMSPKPTVEKIVTVKYSASVRERSSWLKLPEPCADIRKYVQANNSRKSGTTSATASTARMPGCLDLRTVRICQFTTAMNRTSPTTARTPADRRHSSSIGSGVVEGHEHGDGQQRPQHHERDDSATLPSLEPSFQGCGRGPSLPRWSVSPWSPPRGRTPSSSTASRTRPTGAAGRR